MTTIPSAGSPKIAAEESSVVEYLILALTGSAGVILVLIAASRTNLYWKEVLLGLGHALVIAALVGFFVEMRLVREAVRRMEAVHTKTAGEIKRMVVRGLRNYLPDRLVDALEEQVLDPIFLREEFSIAIDLHTEENEGVKCVKGSIALSYFVKNISTKDQTHIVRCNLDEVLGEGSSCLESVAINKQPINLSDLPSGSRIYREANALCFEYPVSIPEGGRVHVQIVGYQLMAPADLWPWHMLTPSDSLTVTVNNPTDLEVSLSPLHPAADNAKNLVTQSAWNAQMTINNIVLPYQGFELRWRPRPLAATNALKLSGSASRLEENKSNAKRAATADVKDP